MKKLANIELFFRDTTCVDKEFTLACIRRNFFTLKVPNKLHTFADKYYVGGFGHINAMAQTPCEFHKQIKSVVAIDYINFTLSMN